MLNNVKDYFKEVISLVPDGSLNKFYVFDEEGKYYTTIITSLTNENTKNYPEVLMFLKDKVFSFFESHGCTKENKSTEYENHFVYCMIFSSEILTGRFETYNNLDDRSRKLRIKTNFIFPDGFSDSDLKELHDIFKKFQDYEPEDCFDDFYLERII